MQYQFKEYGANINKLAQYILTIKDRDFRTQQAHTLVKLMLQLRTDLKADNETVQRVWNHLHMMTNFELDVDCPYPIPDKEALAAPPEAVPYNQGKVIYRHYGRNIELMIEKIKDFNDPEERAFAVNYMARLMKTFYQKWNRDSIEDEVILEELDDLADGELDMENIEDENIRSLYRKAKTRQGKNQGGNRNQRNRNSGYGNGRNYKNRKNNDNNNRKRRNNFTR